MRGPQPSGARLEKGRKTRLEILSRWAGTWWPMSCFCRTGPYGWLAGAVSVVEAWVITLRDRRGCGAYVKSSSGSSPAATTFNCGAGTVYILVQNEASVKNGSCSLAAEGDSTACINIQHHKKLVPLMFMCLLSAGRVAVTENKKLGGKEYCYINSTC